MKILISNDDGVQSEGIKKLAEVAREFGEVTIVAPHRERSTAGHSLTLHKPLRIHQLGDGVYSTSGSPADCIYLGIREILKAKPDVILSGINMGANLGTDIHYSGTVAAAREGALLNIRSFAFSLVDTPEAMPKTTRTPLRFEEAAKVAHRALKALWEVTFPKHTLININIPNLPASEVKELIVARQGFRYYSNEAMRRTDPRGKDYFWLGGSYSGFEPGWDTDCEALEKGKVAVTPITIDCTHNDFYTTLQKLNPSL
jgi:5'-nucleotidase